MNRLKFSIGALALLTSLDGEAKALSLRIENAWIRPMAPSAEVTASFFTIENMGESDDALLKAESFAFKELEVHKTTIQAGKVKMEQVTEVPLPKGSKTAFAPQGLHLMLIHPVKQLKEGDEVELALTFKKAGVLKVKAKIKDKR